MPTAVAGLEDSLAESWWQSSTAGVSEQIAGWHLEIMLWDPAVPIRWADHQSFMLEERKNELSDVDPQKLLGFVEKL